MKLLSKKMLASTILASFVLGSAGTLHNHAFADTASTSTQAAAPADGAKFDAQGHGPGGGMGGSDIFKETATLLGIEQSVLMESLQDGKTLAEIAEANGLTEDEYLQKLTAAIQASASAAVTAGTMTQEQADQLTSGLSDRLKKQIENKAFGERPAGSTDMNDQTKGQPGERPDQTKTDTSANNDTATDHSLTDINNHWAAASIKHLVAKGVLQGDENKHFNPDKTVTREELASMVTRSFNLESSAEASASTDTQFLDVPQSRWSFKNVEAAKDYFDSEKDSSGKLNFKPTEGAKREDVAVTLVKVMLKKDSSISLLDADAADQLLKEEFKDADSIPSALRTYVATAAKHGYLQGDDQGNFAPEKTITRAEVATLLDRLLGGSTDTK